MIDRFHPKAKYQRLWATQETEWYGITLEHEGKSQHYWQRVTRTGPFGSRLYAAQWPETWKRDVRDVTISALKGLNASSVDDFKKAYHAIQEYHANLD